MFLTTSALAHQVGKLFHTVNLFISDSFSSMKKINDALAYRVENCFMPFEKQITKASLYIQKANLGIVSNDFLTDQLGSFVLSYKVLFSQPHKKKK